jgi:hypothetical protein
MEHVNVMVWVRHHPSGILPGDQHVEIVEIQLAEFSISIDDLPEAPVR